MEETRVYSCPSCGAPMKYSITNEKLKCRFCSNTYDLEYIRTHFTEVTDEKLSDFNWIDRTKYVWEPYDQEYLEEFDCPSCGGKISTKAYYGTAKCPFCKHDVVITSDFDGDIRPDKVIPFKVTKAEFIEKYQEYISRIRKVPKPFKDIDAVKEVVGCYIPVWLYSCLCGEGNTDPSYKPLWTKDYPILANDTDISREVFYTILPYKFDEAEKFTESCLAGFPASRYIIGAENAMKTADKEIKDIYYSQKKVDYKFKSDKKKPKVSSTEDLIDSLEGVKLDFENTSYRKLSYYVVPVWLLTVTYNLEEYIFAMNGQTGKMRVDGIPKKRRVLFPCLLIAVLIQALIFAYFFIPFAKAAGEWRMALKIMSIFQIIWLPVSIALAVMVGKHLKKKKKYHNSKDLKDQKIWSVKDFISWEKRTEK